MDAKHRIVIVAPETLPVPPEQGGAVQRVIHEQSTRLNDYEITMICPRGAGQPAEERQNHIRYIRLDVPVLERKGATRNEYIKRVAMKLENLPVDLIHIHNRPEYVLPLAEKKSPILLHMHNRHLENIPRWKREKIIAACTHLIFVSEFLKDGATKDDQTGRCKSSVVYNGIDTARFAPRWKHPYVREWMRSRYGLAAGDIVLLYVGRIVPEKGLLPVIRAMKRLGERGKRIKLLVIGASHFGTDEKNEYEVKVRQEAEGLPSAVFFEGYIDQKDLPKYYHMADVFISPVRWDEPFGLVIGEAAACGLPIIATGRGAIPELIKHRQEGLLLPPRYKLNHIIRALKQIVLDPRLRETLSREARMRMEERFTWDNSAQKIKGIYEKILKVG